MKKLKGNRGITLIALIITIIVMIILVGVTVAVALNGGLFTKAMEASLQTVISEIQEKIDLKYSTILADYYKGDLDEDIGDFTGYFIEAMLEEWQGEDYSEYFCDENMEEFSREEINMKLRPELLEYLGIKTAYGKGEENYQIESYELEKDVFLLRYPSLKVMYRGKDGITYPFADISKYIKTDGNGTITYIDVPNNIADTDNIVIPNQINGEKINKIGTYAFSGLELDRNENGTLKLDEDGYPILTEDEDLGPTGEATKIRSIIISDGIEEIEAGAFAYCTNLERIKIPNTVTSIGDRAFDSCENLKSIIIPDSVTELGEETFIECYSLERIVLSDNIKTLSEKSTYYENGVFHDCKALEEIKLPKNLEVIGIGTFYGCTSLKKITIPNSVTEIRKEAFSPFTMEAIEFEAGSNPIPEGSPWGAINGVTITKLGE